MDVDSIKSSCRSVLLAVFVVLAIVKPCPAGEETEKAWKSVSIPDFLNVDLDYPQPTWEDALDYVLEAIKAGVNKYAVKQFTAERLSEKINQTLAKIGAAAS